MHVIAVRAFEPIRLHLPEVEALHELIVEVRELARRARLRIEREQLVRPTRGVVQEDD